jgi:hypothetical protein
VASDTQLTLEVRSQRNSESEKSPKLRLPSDISPCGGDLQDQRLCGSSRVTGFATLCPDWLAAFGEFSSSTSVQQDCLAPVTEVHPQEVLTNPV